MLTVGKRFLIFLTVFTLPAIAQITRPTAEQAPPVPGVGQRHVAGLNESVNPATGAVSIRIDAGVPPARGVTVPFAFGYDSNAAQHVVGGLGVTDNASYLGQGGWSYVVPMLSEIQSTFSVANHAILGSTNPVDPVVFVPCQLGDPSCFVPAGSNGPGCTAVFCPPTAPGQTTTTPTTCAFYDHFNFVDMSGSVHDLGITSQNGTPECVSVAGAPVTALTGRDNMVVAQATTPNAVPSTTLVDNSGTYYSFPSSSTLPNSNQQQSRVHTRVGDNPNLRSYLQFDMLPSFVEDRNGNIAVFTDHGSGSFDVTDTLGRTAISTSGFGTSGNTVRIAGLANPYTVTWTPLSPNWQMNVQIIAPNIPATVPRTSCSAGPGPAVYNVSGQIVPLHGITQLLLPNGQSYQFQYEPIYGLVSKMIYPSGGYVRFVWGVNGMSGRELVPSTEPLASAGVPFPCEIIYDTPAVIQRFVSFNGQTEVEEQDFSYSTIWAPVRSTVDTGMRDWTSKQTTVITKDLVTGTNFSTVYTYVPKPNGARPSAIEGQAGMVPTSPVEQTVQNLDANGHVLRTVSKDYHYGALFPAADETVTLDNGQTSRIHRCFAFTDCSGQPPAVGQVLGALLTETFEYDFGQGVAGPLLRHTHIDYSMFKSPLFPDIYINIFGNPSTYLGVPQASIVYDGNGIRVAETDYIYDSSAISGAAASSHDETNYGAAVSVTRVNLTSITRKCFNSVTALTCPDAVTTFTYDETGQVVTTKDPLANVTSFSYQDNFTDPSPATNTNAYLTNITLPQTGVAHTQTFSYAYSDGQLTSSTDQNGQKTRYSYDDPFRRLTETDLPDGGQTSVSYNDVGPNPNMVTTRKITSTSGTVSTSVMDGMTHTIQTQLNSDPAGADFVDTMFDGLGRPMRISNPHRGTPLTTDGVMSTKYDALGRVTQITKQDGSVSTISYAGSCSVVIDEAGKRRRGCTDALGRLIEVDEPTPGVSETTLASNAAANVTISGSLQFKQSSSRATGTVAINGTDSIVPGTNAFDFGTVTVSVGNGSVTASYGNSGSSASSGVSVAAALCSAINSTSSTSAVVTCSTNGTVMTLNALAAGSAGNGIVLGINAQTSLPQSTKSAFSTSTTSGSLSGGGAPVYDSASSTIAVAGYADTASWSGSGTTPASVALSLATSINNDPSAYVTASASGGTVTLVSKIVGLGGNISLSCSSGYDSTNFAAPSFSISCPSALSGGSEAGSLSVPMLTLYRYDALSNLLQVTQQGGAADQTQYRVRTFNYDSLSRLSVATNPESGTINYSYDVDGNLLQQLSPQPNQTGAAQQTVSYCYDQLNRITGKAYSSAGCTNGQFSSGTAVIAYQYDQGINGVGRLSSLTDQAGSAAYSYDLMGRISTEQRTITGVTKNMSYTYNLDGSVATATYPSGAVITYTPDPDGRVGMVQDLGNNINFVAGPGGLGTSATYAPDGSLTGFLAGATTSFPGITNTFSFNNRLQPVNVAALSAGPNSTAIVSLSGTLQSITSGATNPTAGTVNITITGTERSVTTGGTKYCGAFDSRGRCVDWEVSSQVTTADSGTVTITVNGHADSTSYGSGSDTTAVASGLATAINKDANAFVNATAASGMLSLSARQTGATTNYSWSLSSSSSDSADFGSAGSFSSNPTSGALTGGGNGDPGTTVYDSGSVSIAIGSFQAAVPYGLTTNASASAVASALAAATNVAPSPATATVNGTTLSLTWKAAGNVTTAVSALATTHSQSSVFTTPSFASPTTKFGGGANVTVFSRNYDFHVGNGDNGNLYGVTNNVDGTRNHTFAYDSLNRLVSAQNAGTDCNQLTANGKTKFWGNSYDYDAWGNLLHKNVTKCSAEYLNATADAQNRIHVVAPDYRYDAAGNMLSDSTDGISVLYDAENRIASVTQGGTTTAYVYDAEGNRLKKSTNTSGTLYWYMLPGIVAESDLSGNLKSEYVFFSGRRIARRDYPGGAVSYYFSDHLKTTGIITDAQGNVKSDSDYYPWGGELQFVVSDSNHYKFTGKERDTESGLDYFGARYYSNAMARFTSVDPKQSSGYSIDPQTWNRYAYVGNNPLRFIDPDGKEKIEIIVYTWIPYDKTVMFGTYSGGPKTVARFTVETDPRRSQNPVVKPVEEKIQPTVKYHAEGKPEVKTAKKTAEATGYRYENGTALIEYTQNSKNPLAPAPEALTPGIKVNMIMTINTNSHLWGSVTASDFPAMQITATYENGDTQLLYSQMPIANNTLLLFSSGQTHFDLARGTNTCGQDANCVDVPNLPKQEDPKENKQ
jgi:RHS repeat-associated protein